MKAKILKAECSAHGVHLVTTGARRGLHFQYREFAFTAEIREAQTRSNVTHKRQPFNGIVMPKEFVLTRTVRA